MGFSPIGEALTEIFSINLLTNIFIFSNPKSHLMDIMWPIIQSHFHVSSFYSLK